MMVPWRGVIVKLGVDSIEVINQVPWTSFSPPATVSVIQSLAFKMLTDPVANVRRAGAMCVGTIANRLDGEFGLADTFINRLRMNLQMHLPITFVFLFVEVHWY